MNIVEELKARGLLAQTTNGLEEHLSEPRTFYCGFDPTADSLHVGSLLPIITMIRLQKAGHRAIALIGGATGRIGDPSFKAAERTLNSTETVEQWSRDIEGQLTHFLNRGHGEVVIANNWEWMKDVNVIDFLRDTGKHFSVNAMIAKESVKQRLARDGVGISFTEFSYMLLQSQDFAHLQKSFDCTVQIGGSDQWGNIVGGIDLCRRQNGCEAFGMTIPLVTKADGTKFGKTESGTVWLDPEKTSPYEFFQFWINVSDEDVYDYLKMFTFLSLDVIETIRVQDEEIKAHGGKPRAQETLAKLMTAFVHGDEAAASCMRIKSALFSSNSEYQQKIQELTEQDLLTLKRDGVNSVMVLGDVGLVPALVDIANAVKSRKQAREHLQSGAIRVNGEIVSDTEFVLNKENSLYGKFWLVRVGKKKHHLFYQ